MPKEAAGLHVADGDVGDTFADEAIGFQNLNGTIRITFAVSKLVEPVPPSDMYFEPVGRLILPIDSARRLCVSLYDFLKNQRLDPNEILGNDPSGTVN